MNIHTQIFDAGVYTPRQAARLIGAQPRDVLRWTRGSGPNDPIWRAHYQTLEDATEISFLDLVEVRVVHGLRRAGASLQSIRFSIDLAQSQYGLARPLASQKFYFSGSEILMDAIEGDGELVSLSKKRPTQKVFKKIVEQSLSDIEFENEVAARWRPSWVDGIVLDPKRQFGSPIIDEFGVSTDAILQDLSNGLSEKQVASLYELPIELVKSARKFELKLERDQAAA